MNKELQEAYDATRKGSGPYWIDLPREEQFRLVDIAEALNCQEIEDLKEQVSELESDLEDSEESVKALEKERDDLKEKVDAAKEALSDTAAKPEPVLAVAKKRR
jgi:FtsZ-binding cell division protein ZapB